MATEQEEDKEVIDYLGLTKLEMAQRSSEFPLFLIRRVAEGKETVPKDLVDFIKEFYTYNELVYFAVNYLIDKTSIIMDKPETREFLRNIGRNM